MRKLKTYLILISAICSFATNTIAKQDYSVGFRIIEAKIEGGFSGGVWYPSVDQEYEKKIGSISPYLGMGWEPS